MWQDLFETWATTGIVLLSNGLCELILAPFFGDTHQETDPAAQALLLTINTIPMNSDGYLKLERESITSYSTSQIYLLLMNIRNTYIIMKGSLSLYNRLRKRYLSIMESSGRDWFIKALLVLIWLGIYARVYIWTREAKGSITLPLDVDTSMLYGSHQWEDVVTSAHKQGYRIETLKFDEYKDGWLTNYTVCVSYDGTKLYHPEMEGHRYKHTVKFRVVEKELIFTFDLQWAVMR
jgi:hypothetical protein